MTTKFEMVAKTFAGLEQVLAAELTELGAEDVKAGTRMVSFSGDLGMLYKANMCCRTALRILKPFYKFKARTPEQLYDHVKEYDWSSMMSVNQTFSIDTVTYSDEFHHSQFVTYKVKDAIADWFRDHTEDGSRPRVRLENSDIMINVHISGTDVTLSLDSSGESLHRRGYRVGQTEAPISEVLAAGIILMTGYKGDVPFVDPMCGSGTFAIEAALIAANIIPGVFRKHYAFENWKDFDRELFEEIYNDDSAEREITMPIIAADISPKAIEIATSNAKSAGVARYIEFRQQPIARWEEAPKPAGILVTNPPYGKRISADDMNALYQSIGTCLKKVFTGYHAWIIGYQDEYFHEIGLAPSQKIALNNGGLECELREYVIFEGSKRNFRAAGGRIKDEVKDKRSERQPRKFSDRKSDDRMFDGKKSGDRKFKDRKFEGKKFEGKKFEGRKFEDKKFEGRKFEGKKFEGRRPEFSERQPRHDQYSSEQPREHRPIDLTRLGKQPSIPADKAIVLRPAWRVRKNKSDNNSENTEK